MAGLVAAGPVVAVPGIDTCVALLSYEGTAPALVAALKYRNSRAGLSRLAVAMAALVDPADVDVVTWAPTSAERRRHRGYDQAELLALRLARQIARPSSRLLRRIPGPPQTGRSSAERARGVHFVERRGVPCRVLVVDDVVTTGATLGAAAAALRRGGAAQVHAAVLARTPTKAQDPTAPRVLKIDRHQVENHCG